MTSNTLRERRERRPSNGREVCKLATEQSASYIEIVNPDLKVGQLSSVLFDFDGTISVIREGWQEIMGPLMVEVLMDAPDHEDQASLDAFVRELIAITTGRDTIYQMIDLAEEVKKRGGIPKDPMDYKREYLRRLWLRIEHRVRALEDGEADPRDWVMEGAMDMLEEMKRRGLAMYVASGTDHVNVVHEANALGVAHYFGEHIYGALDNYWERSKAKIIKDLLEKNDLHGSSLVVFGDGFVEIENCKEVGGLAIGVASDEVHRRGVNDWKRERLIRAGADVIIPDYTDIPALMELLFP